jgi:serine/threonine-protein kinase
MDTDAGTIARQLALFDELADLDAAARAARLAEIAATDPALAAAVRAMLAADPLEGPLDAPLELAAATVVSGVAVVPRAAHEPGRRVGGFVLERLLGRGGMGEVWLAARDRGGVRQAVALKLLRTGMDNVDLRARFAQEGRILATLSHPAIARFIDAGVDEDGAPWYAMAWVEGVPIDRHVRERGLDLRARIALVATVAEAVAHAQSHLVVHRDIKPSNVLVDVEGRPHLLDFGIAKLLDPGPVEGTETATGLRALSPAYAAPEQVLGEPVSAATDVYALGVLTYVLVTGVLPHARDAVSLERLADLVRRETVERPSLRLREGRSGPGAVAAADARRVVGDLDTIVLMALRAERERRYPSAAAYAADLRRWLDGRTVSAQPDTASYRLRRFVARNRLAVGSAAVVALALVFGSALALWQASLARIEARRTAASIAFVTSLFRAGDPRAVERVDDVETLLANGAERARSELADDPALQGHVLLRLAEVYVSRGEFGVAEPLLDEARERLWPRLPQDDPQRAEWLLAAGQVSADQQRNDEAGARLREAGERFGRLGRVIDEARADSVRAGLLRRMADMQGALALSRSVVARLEKQVGAEHAQTAYARIDLAVYAEDAGEYVLAETSLRAALVALERAGREGEPSRAYAEVTLAGLLDRLGRASEAEPLFRDGMARSRALYGADGAALAPIRLSYGIFLLGQQRPAEAEVVFGALIDSVNANPTSRAHALRYRGLALIDLERHAEAEATLTEAEAAYRAFGDQAGSLQAARARADRGHVVVLAGRIEEGVQIMREGIAGIEAIRGTRHTELLRPLLQLGAALADRGEIGLAREVYTRAHADALALLGAEHQRTQAARAALEALNASSEQ